MKHIATFKRNEKKYKLNSAQYGKFILELNKHMTMDSYGEHTISNIYFDTDNFDLIRTSLEKPLYKEKLRLRAYGQVEDNTKSFLEIKKKYDGIVYKRRIPIKYSDYVELINNNGKIEWDKDKYEDKQIFNEIKYFFSMYKPKEKVIVAYDRCAYFSADNDLRLTIDRNIRSRNADLDLKQGAHGINILPKDQYLIEIKTTTSMPMWLTRVLSENEIYPVSFSKYGEYYKTLVCKKEGQLYVG